MAFSTGMYLTNIGRLVQAAAQTGTELHFTRMEMGDGVLSGQLEVDRTALISPKQSLDLTKLRINSDGTATVGAAFQGSTVGSFYWRELGLWVRDPNNANQEILYGYANAGSGAQAIPAAGAAEIVEKTINVVIAIGNAGNVTATIASGIYASAADLALKADKRVYYAKTLTAAGWTGSSAPFTQTISLAAILGTNTPGEVGLSEAISVTEMAAALDAQLHKSGQAVGSLTVIAFGDKPTVDIPVTVAIGG